MAVYTDIDDAALNALLTEYDLGPPLAFKGIAEGVENMQLDYGVDSEGAGGPSHPFIQAPTLAQWPDVVAVNISLLVRNPAETIGYQDAKTYNLGLAGSVLPIGDRYKRHVYSSGVRVINVSGRKE